MKKQTFKLTYWSQLTLALERNALLRFWVGVLGTTLSVVVCLLILPTRLPGMELAGIGPNWLLIWVVAWSLNRSMWQGAMAGLVLGLLQDAMTALDPSHVLSLMVVGCLTAKLQTQRYLKEDFISVALVVFGMAIVAETVMALQFSVQGTRTLMEIWQHHQLVALSSAILSSLWAPVISFPLNRWWEWTALPVETSSLGRR